MKKDFIIVGAICLILASLAGADYLATTINTDGSVMLANSGIGENGSFSSRAMAIDSVEVTRSISDGAERADLAMRSNGPLLVSDYASAIWKKVDFNSLCALIRSSDEPTTDQASMYTSGIFRKGEYDGMRSLKSGLAGETFVNGTGMLVFGSQGEENHSVSGSGFVSGNMSVHDLVTFGGRL